MDLITPRGFQSQIQRIGHVLGPQVSAEFPQDNIAVAGPDMRYGSGKLYEVINSRGDFKSFLQKGFKMYRGGVLKGAETAAIEACEAQNGQGKCYVYLKNGRNVRLVEHKKWLARNPIELALIAEEKAKEKERLNRQAKASTTTTYVPTAKKEPDYEAAIQLFGIANQALKSTMPQPSNSLNCTTTSGGYLTGTVTTNCR